MNHKADVIGWSAFCSSAGLTDNILYVNLKVGKETPEFMLKVMGQQNVSHKKIS